MTDGSNDPTQEEEPVPLMQRLMNNIWLLLVVGMLIMLVVYTGWGTWEMLTLPTATLP